MVLLGLTLAGCAPGAAGPGGCTLTQRADLPLTLRRDVPLVHATIDGAAVTLILDTGAQTTLLTDAAVTRLHLARDDAAHGARILGVGPAAAVSDADAARLDLGRVVLRNRPVIVAGFALASDDRTVPDGLLGDDILSQYDLDLDLPDGRATLYRARDCPGAAPPVVGDWTAVVAERTPRGQLRVPMTIDGQTLGAIVDTGSETTTVAVAALPRLHMTEAMLAGDPRLRVRGMSEDATLVHVHRFDELRIGPLSYRHPYIPVAPLPDFLGDGLLGADVLRLHRVWLSWASARIWIDIARRAAYQEKSRAVAANDIKMSAGPSR